MEKTTMSVQKLSAQMGISLPKAYELVKSEGFPSIRIGTRILIPVDAFREWLVITSNKLEKTLKFILKCKKAQPTDQSEGCASVVM